MITLAQRVDQLIEQHGSLRAAARAIRIDSSYLSRLQHGEKCAPSKATLRKMGLRGEMVYTLHRTL